MKIHSIRGLAALVLAAASLLPAVAVTTGASAASLAPPLTRYPYLTDVVGRGRRALEDRRDRLRGHRRLRDRLEHVQRHRQQVRQRPRADLGDPGVPLPPGHRERQHGHRDTHRRDGTNLRYPDLHVQPTRRRGVTLTGLGVAGSGASGVTAAASDGRFGPHCPDFSTGSPRFFHGNTSGPRDDGVRRAPSDWPLRRDKERTSADATPRSSAGFGLASPVTPDDDLRRSPSITRYAACWRGWWPTGPGHPGAPCDRGGRAWG